MPSPSAWKLAAPGAGSRKSKSRYVKHESGDRPGLQTQCGDVASEKASDLAAMGPSVLPAGFPDLLEKDADLRRLVECWPTLPEHVRQTIRMLLESAGTKSVRIT